MDKQNFEQAEYAFGRAGLERERKIALAYLDREVAVSEEEFRTVALSLEGCAKLSEGMPDHKELVVSAAGCYSRARAFTESARLYYSVSEYTKCTQRYLKASMMEAAHQVVRNHKDDINELVVKKVCEHFLDRREYVYSGNHIVWRLLKVIRPPRFARVEQIFRNRGELIDFMKRHDLPTHLAAYFEFLGRFHEAAEVYLGLNKVIKAIELFFRDNQTISVERGTDHLLRELWRRYTLGRPVESMDSKKLISLLSRREELLDTHPVPHLEQHKVILRWRKYLPRVIVADH